jgi:hypothetical protein
MNITTAIIPTTCSTINLSSDETLAFGFLSGVIISIILWVSMNIIPRKLFEP